ncbi:hypothetical protein HJG60_008333 [Phyllostomus discolor]|uniref:Uncharacterized protein n=1 Tax=Phyllostomus discolor TaxID=89673 RepID=A0A834DM29_9CHIR|nr:hypothetical protein HJG60_008333 [Phyllostomus discolor]
MHSFWPFGWRHSPYLQACVFKCFCTPVDFVKLSLCYTGSSERLQENYTHTHIYVYTHTRIGVYMCMCVCVCVYIHIPIYIWRCVSACTWWWDPKSLLDVTLSLGADAPSVWPVADPTHRLCSAHTF